jgi:hypothetical protein
MREDPVNDSGVVDGSDRLHPAGAKNNSDSEDQLQLHMSNCRTTSSASPKTKISIKAAGKPNAEATGAKVAG